VGVRARIGVGERGPDFVLKGPSGEPARFYAHAGGCPIALVFGRDGAGTRMAELTDLLAGRGDVVVTSVGEPSAAKAYGVDAEQPTVVVLDPDLRVLGVVADDQPSADVVALLESGIHGGPDTEVKDQAPVLFIARVLDAEQQHRLIGVAQREGDVETGVERFSEGSQREVLDAGYKRRRDHTVRDPDLLRELSSVVGRRVMPEVRKAFAFRATRFEGFKIACYDATTGGFFRAHRDNLTPSTAHRVFALTLNLNDEYEGGQLRFPEYGNQLYRPDAGAALVFSCAHLHEVRDVTTGRRFVLLSFLYGEPAPPAAR
jgi:predicted 2-oxoglutarate/Fe(II)-dependent dioxygenase YbiX